jgi:glucosamine--fructose-6-phosphate aminotransferase (isomerizing)
MPESLPGLSFDAQGVCQYCKDYTEGKPLGAEALREVVQSVHDEHLRWDCLVPLSGGRDSTYALYYASKILKRKVLAVTFNNEFHTPIARKNMEAACKKLGIELKMGGSKRGYFKKIVRETIRCAPSLKQLSICRACDIGIKSVVFRTALENKIPLIIWGESQFEQTSDMTPKALHALKGLRSRYWKLLSPRFYLGEFYMLLFKRELRVPGNNIFKRGTPALRNSSIKQVRLYDYIPWDRSEIKKVIHNELGWEKPEDSITSWKIDCALYPLVNYEFFKLFGCSKDCFGYSRMINSGQMSREEALQQENFLADHYKEHVPELLQNTIGLSIKEAKKILSL